MRAAALAVLAACSSAPEVPTFRDDVKPIVEANCARCHGLVPRGGAPDTFRLDVFGDVRYDDGRVALGAAQMSGFMAARTHAETMPPTVPLSDTQIEVLDRWFLFDEFNDPERGEPDPTNGLPAIELTDTIAVDDDGIATVSYAISDPDFEIVTGTLRAISEAGDERVVSRELYSGRREARWDTGVFEAGLWELRAELADGHDSLTVILGELEIAHPGDNRAPSPAFCRLSRDTLIVDQRLPMDIEISVDDDNTQISVELLAERAGESISLGAMTDVPARDCDAATPLAISVADTSALAEGGNWRLRLAASDGQRTREVRSLPVIVGHRDSGPSFSADVARIFLLRCSGCHGGGLAPVGARFQTFAGASSKEGAIYRYVVQTQIMPPRSAELLVSDFEPMTAAERQTVADWLLAGALDN